jgi:hypothetical protein
MLPPVLLRMRAALALVLDSQTANASEDALLKRADAATAAELAAAHFRLSEIERGPRPMPLWRQQRLPDGTTTWVQFDTNRLRRGLRFDINGQPEAVAPEPVDNAHLLDVVELPDEFAEAVNRRSLHLDLRDWEGCGSHAMFLLYLSAMKRKLAVRRDLVAARRLRAHRKAREEADARLEPWMRTNDELDADDAAGYERKIWFEDAPLRSRLAEERRVLAAETPREWLRTQLRERVAAGNQQSTKKGEARWLWEAFTKKFPDVTLPGPETIRKNYMGDYRAPKPP